MCRHAVTMFFIVVAILLFAYVPAHSQDTPPQLDVVGLRLGMSVEEAKAQLLKYKPGIWNVTTYLTENRSWWGGGGIAPQADAGTNVHPFHDAALKVPIQIGAGYFEKAYAGLKVIDNQNTPIEQYSGEFFRLSFTPTESGGKLYSIVRQRVYFSDRTQALRVYAAAEIPLPKLSDLENGLIEKYGSPGKNETGSDYVSLGWIYDQNGEKVPSASPEFARCESKFDGEDGTHLTPLVAGYRPRPSYHSPLWSMRRTGGGGNLTLHEFAGAFSNVEFYKLGWGDSIRFLDDTATKFAREFVPLMVTDDGREPSDTQGNLKFRECGTQVHVVVTLVSGQDRGSGIASVLTVSLSDQNAEFFNNGVREYMKARVEKLNKLPPSPTTKEKF